MKPTSLFIISMIFLFIISGCEKGPEKKVATVAQPETQQLAQGTLGKVVEKMNDGDGYTFVLIDTGKEQFWVAAPEFKVSTGSMVIVPEGTHLTNYHSNPLNRDFDTVVFVDTITEAPSGQPVSPQPAGAPQVATPATVK